MHEWVDDAVVVESSGLSECERPLMLWLDQLLSSGIEVGIFTACGNGMRRRGRIGPNYFGPDRYDEGLGDKAERIVAAEILHVDGARCRLFRCRVHGLGATASCSYKNRSQHQSSAVR